MSFTDGIAKSLSGTKQETEIGIGGFRLFAKVNESTNYSNVVPIDVLEDGTNSTDDIINNPIVVSINGVVGDLFVEPTNFPELISKDYSLVGEVTALLPSKSMQQLQRISQINTQLREASLLADRAKRIGGNVKEFFNNSASTAKSAQDKFVEFMEVIYYSGQPIKLSTNRRDYDNMALSDLTIDENNEDGEVKFSVRFTQINFLELVFVEVRKKYSSPSGAVSGKTSGVASKGGQTPESNTETSLLSSIFG